MKQIKQIKCSACNRILTAIFLSIWQWWCIFDKIKGGIILGQNKFEPRVVGLRLLPAAALEGCDLEMLCNNLHVNAEQPEPALSDTVDPSESLPSKEIQGLVLLSTMRADGAWTQQGDWWNVGHNGMFYLSRWIRHSSEIWLHIQLWLLIGKMRSLIHTATGWPYSHGVHCLLTSRSVVTVPVFQLT